MPTARRPDEVARAFRDAAEDAGIAYCFVGAVAVGAWGQPRATSDIDCLVELPPGKDAAFAAALRARQLYVNPREFEDARRDPSHVTIFDDTGGYNVDCKLARTAHEIEEVRMARELQTALGPLRVAGAEETVAFKVLFGSEQDLKDARSILIRQRGKLDEARLLDHARRLGVEKQVHALLRKHAEP